MPRILSTGKQFIVTISPEVMKAMGWKKGTELILSKTPGEKVVYLEEIGSGKEESKKGRGKKR